MITQEQAKTAKKVLDCAYEVHSYLGSGLLESAYQACLQYELQQHGLFVECEKPIPVVYKGITIDCGYRVDMIIEHNEEPRSKLLGIFVGEEIYYTKGYIPRSESTKPSLKSYKFSGASSKLDP